MQKVVIDVGTNTLKGYIVNDKKEVKYLCKPKSVMLDDCIIEKNGMLTLKPDARKELFEKIVEMRQEAQNIGITAKDIYIYGKECQKTSVKDEKWDYFRKDIKYNIQIENIQVLSPELERKYLTKAVTGRLQNLEIPYLICCVGGRDTQMVVIQNGEMQEEITIPFASNMIRKNEDCERLRKNIFSGPIEPIQKIIEENMNNLPKTQCEHAIFLGFHKTYTNLLKEEYPSHSTKGTLFYNDKIDRYITVEDYKKGNELARHKTIRELQSKYATNRNFMLGTRANCLITEYILEQIGAKYYYPTDLNIVYGITEELFE